MTVRALRLSFLEISRLVSPCVTRLTTSSSRLVSRTREPLNLCRGAARASTSSTDWSSSLVAQICPLCTAEIHLQSASNDPVLQKIPLAPARKALMTISGSEASTIRMGRVFGNKVWTSRRTARPASSPSSRFTLTNAIWGSCSSRALRTSRELMAHAQTRKRGLDLRKASVSSWPPMRVPSDTRTLIASGTDLELCCILKPLKRGRKAVQFYGHTRRMQAKSLLEDEIFV